jgi:hypothetical protein
MARAAKAEPEIFVAIEPHVTVITDDDGAELELLYRRGDRLPGDHPAVRQADKFWLPLNFTVEDEAKHRRRHGLHGRG